MAEGVVHACAGGHVVALRLSDGVELWRATIGMHVQPHALIVLGDDVVASGSFGVSCFEGTTGRLKWRVPVTNLLGASADVRLSIVDGVVVVGVIGTVTGINLATGQRVWHAPLKGLGVGHVVVGRPLELERASS